MYCMSKKPCPFLYRDFLEWKWTCRTDDNAPKRELNSDPPHCSQRSAVMYTYISLAASECSRLSNRTDGQSRSYPGPARPDKKHFSAGYRSDQCRLAVKSVRFGMKRRGFLSPKFILWNNKRLTILKKPNSKGIFHINTFSTGIFCHTKRILIFTPHKIK